MQVQFVKIFHVRGSNWRGEKQTDFELIAETASEAIAKAKAILKEIDEDRASWEIKGYKEVIQ